MGAADSIPRIRRVRACDRFEGAGHFCKVCQFRDCMHTVGCSQCGAQFRWTTRNEGYSTCSQHAHRKAVEQ